MAFTASFIIENDAAFQRGLDRLGRTVSDFRIPFREIGKSFFKSNRKLFTLRSAGLYQPLAPSQAVGPGGIRTTSNYEEQKTNRLGFAYPIFRGDTGVLEASLTQQTSAHAVFQLGKRTLVMGTEVDYAIYHQSDRGDRKKLPQRKVIFIDGGPAEVAQDAEISGRLEAWLNIINDHILQSLDAPL